MGIGKYNRIIKITDDTSFECDSGLTRVKDIVMTDMCMSKVYFVDRSKHDKLLVMFTIQTINASDSDSYPMISQISVTLNHIMLRVREDLLPEETSETSSSDNTRIPEIRPSTMVEAKNMKVGDYIPQWAGGYGIIIGRETVVGKSIQIMTKSGILMINKNIVTCYVAPYSACYYASKPVSFLCDVNHHLVKKPFYALPKKLYKRYFN